MAILLCITDRDVRPLRDTLGRLLDTPAPIWIYPELPDPAAVEMVVVWKHPPGLLAALPNLRLISSVGAGVEHIITDPARPAGVAVTRIVDEALTASMRSYVLLCVLSYHRRFRELLDQQRRRQWRKPDPVERPLRVGVLGLGALGGDIARALAGLGFDTYGYSFTPRQVEGVHCFAAADATVAEFAARVNVLACLLPRTPATEGILNYELFRRLPPGSALINAARGAHLVEADLLRALDEGRIAEAYLDVFREEPLTAGHPFWAHPGVVITPHIASMTNQENAARIMADNYQRLRTGRPLLFEVDVEKGY